MSVAFTDLIEESVVSNCCGSAVYLEDICCACDEHCEPVDEDVYYGEVE